MDSGHSRSRHDPSAAPRGVSFQPRHRIEHSRSGLREPRHEEVRDRWLELPLIRTQRMQLATPIASREWLIAMRHGLTKATRCRVKRSGRHFARYPARNQLQLCSCHSAKNSSSTCVNSVPSYDRRDRNVADDTWHHASVLATVTSSSCVGTCTPAKRLSPMSSRNRAPAREFLLMARNAKRISEK